VGQPLFLILFQLVQITQNLEYLNGTNIDSSGGQTILTYKGVISGTNNWGLLSTQPATVVSTFIR
jgi:hypothetical protein